MEPQKIKFKYNFNLRNDNAQEVLDYFNGSTFEKYMGSEQDVRFGDTRAIDGRVFEINMPNCGMNDLSKIFSKENKFLPQEISCEKSHCYFFIETILKSQRGDNAKLKRDIFDRLSGTARIRA